LASACGIDRLRFGGGPASLRRRSSVFSSIQNTLPSPDGAFTPMVAAHQFDQALGHHQADAGAFLDVGLLVRDG
jgi:hypothetical protein